MRRDLRKSIEDVVKEEEGQPYPSKCQPMETVLYIPRLCGHNYPENPEVRALMAEHGIEPDKDTCKELTDYALRTLSEIHGGTTSWSGYGTWVNDETGKLEREPVTVIQSFHKCGTHEDEMVLARLIDDLKVMGGQYAVAVKHGTKMYTISSGSTEKVKHKLE
ncbi:MAG: hypothetical protein WC554_18405 [Clostridia bacterium]|nr:hypothetical protein [Sphaerochaeta sp.]